MTWKSSSREDQHELRIADGGESYILGADIEDVVRANIAETGHVIASNFASRIGLGQLFTIHLVINNLKV